MQDPTSVWLQESVGGPRSQVPFWFGECRNHSERMLDTISECSLVKHDFCWQLHEDYFLQCSQRHGKHIIACFHGIYLFLAAESLLEIRNGPCHFKLSYMKHELRMETIRYYLSPNDRIAFTWLVLDLFLIYQCIFMSRHWAKLFSLILIVYI